MFLLHFVSHLIFSISCVYTRIKRHKNAPLNNKVYVDEGNESRRKILNKMYMNLALHYVLIKYVHIKLKCVAYLKSNHVTQTQSEKAERRKREIESMQ